MTFEETAVVATSRDRAPPAGEAAQRVAEVPAFAELLLRQQGA